MDNGDGFQANQAVAVRDQAVQYGVNLERNSDLWKKKGQRCKNFGTYE